MNIDLSSILETIRTFFTSFSTWLIDLFLYIPRQVYEWIVDAALGAFDLLPSLGFINTAYENFIGITSGGGFGSIGGIPIGAGLLYLFAIFKVSTGVGIIVAALTARFILRRIPIIGG